MIDWRPHMTSSGRTDAYSVDGYVGDRHAYIISRATVGGVDQYSAWPRGASAPLSRHNSAQAARAACLAHLQTQGGRHATADR